MKIPKVNVHRHVVIVAVCLVLVAGAGGFVTAKWASHVQAEAKQQAAADKVAKDKAATAQDNHDKAVLAVQTQVNAECGKEAKYYSLLTPVQKKAVVAPACSSITVVR